MVSSALAFIAVLASAFVTRAEVIPSEPSPGSIFNEGQNCRVSWNGDPESTATWKSMAIELMTGDNFNMIHLTTLGTTFDGTVVGQHEFPCPDVTVNSAIYFYQFTSPLTSDKTWTTRFTIAGPAGETTPPANAVQPGSGEKIPWGVGALADPSKAVPPPGGAASSGLPSSSGGLLATTSSSNPLPSSTPLVTNSLPDDNVPSTTRLIVVTSVSKSDSSARTSATTTSDTQANSAIRMSAASAMTALVLPALALMFL